MVSVRKWVRARTPVGHGEGFLSSGPENWNEKVEKKRKTSFEV